MVERWGRRVAVLLALLLARPLMAAGTAASDAMAGEVAPLTVCFNWSCQSQVRLTLPEADWLAAMDSLADARSPADERALLAGAVGRLYAALARRTPVAADRAGNGLDAGVDGRMDCIDHAITTTQLLRGLEARGGLRFHRVAAVQRRTRFVVAQHLSAAVEARPGLLAAMTGAALGVVAPDVFVVDSWFADPGTPAVVLPLAAWMEGEGPDVE